MTTSLVCGCDAVGEDNTVYVSAFRGDTVELDVTFYDVAGEPLDISNWVWACELRDAADVVVTNFGVYDAGPGSLLLELTDVTTAGLAVADYAWDLEGTDDETNVKTLVRGQLRIKEDVTR